MPNPSLEIFSQGEEILTGQVVDTNAAWLSEQAVQMGFAVTRHTAVGDKLDDLVQALWDISKRADCCLCTGGLGPTSDDLTAEAVAKAFGLELVFDEIAYKQILQFFSNRNRQMPDCNRKQALLPQASVRLANRNGTAPGFALQQGRCWFAFMPGVPSEMRIMFQEQIQPKLAKQFSLQPSQLISIKSIGLGESDIQERISKIAIPPQIQLGFRAEIGEVQTKLLFPGDYPHDDINDLSHQIASLIGAAVYTIDGLSHGTNKLLANDLVSVLNELMTAKNQTLSVVETTSQGLLAAKLLGVNWLLSATYEQSIESLTQRLAVNYHPDNLSESAKTIAKAIQEITGATMVLVQLMPDSHKATQTHDQAVTVVNTLLVNKEYKEATRTLAGDLQRKQQQAALLSLDLLRRHLQGK